LSLEDSYNKHTVSESDSTQAANISAVLLKDQSKNSGSAGYAHIAKRRRM
jgi:hypothetical protein